VFLYLGLCNVGK